MTLPNFRIVPQNFHDEAQLFTELPPQPGFPVTNTQSTARDAVWRGSGIVNQYVRGVWPDDGRKLNCFYMFRHNWHGGTIQLQLYNQADWTGLVYDSGQQETVSLVNLGIFDWGTTPLGIVDDPFVSESPFWLEFPAVGAKAYQITMRDTHVQVGATNVEVGRWFLGKYFEVGLNVPTASIGFQDNTERARTRGGSLRTNLGSFWRTLQIEVAWIKDVDRPTWIDIYRRAMTGRDVVVSVLPSDPSVRLTRDYIMNGKFSSLDALGRQVEYMTKRVAVEEN